MAISRVQLAAEIDGPASRAREDGHAHIALVLARLYIAMHTPDPALERFCEGVKDAYEQATADGLR